MKTEITWNDAVNFSAIADSEIEVNIDGPADIGGQNRGVRPMELMLMGLGGCTATDVVHILRKSRCEITHFKTCIRATRATSDPKVFEEIEIHFNLGGP